MIEFPQDDKTKLVRNMEPKKEDYIAVARCFNSFKDSDSWAAYKNPLNEYIVGSIAYYDTNHVQIGPYTPSLTFASIGVSSKRNKLKPKEKMVFTMLYVLSKDLESIRPFAISNYKDYFEEE